jgi:Arc/MetJ-type ribon-helix-helix transcriptional regulator
MSTTRVTVTLPPEVVREMDRLERNRSRFVLEAVRREIDRRREEALRLSLESPHPESRDLAEAGLTDWGGSVSGPGAEDLLLRDGGTAVRWVPGRGFEEVDG